MGTIAGIAVRAARRAPMMCRETVLVSPEYGVAGDHKGARFPKRQVTVMAAEDWAAACALLGTAGQNLEWTVRRANLLTLGLTLPRAVGAILSVGEDVVFEVTGQTVPCRRMDEAVDGLRRVLGPDWRGGVTCRVVAGGTISLGDDLGVTFAPPQRVRRLP